MSTVVNTSPTEAQVPEVEQSISHQVNESSIPEVDDSSFDLDVLIQNPAGEIAFCVEATHADEVLEIRSHINRHPATCHYSDYSLECQGVTLDDYAELGMYPSLFTPGQSSTVKMILRPYDALSASSHLAYFRQLISHPNPSFQSVSYLHSDSEANEVDVAVAMEAARNRFLKRVKHDIVKEVNPVSPAAAAAVLHNSKKKGKEGRVARRVKTAAGSLVTEEITSAAQAMLSSEAVHFNFASDFTMTKLHETGFSSSTFNSANNTFPKLVQRLNISEWSPVPPARLVAGDVLYIDVTSLEGTYLCITASSNPKFKGWYVNKSSIDCFNPTPASQNSFNTLVELCLSVSPRFASAWSNFCSFPIKAHPLEIETNPLPSHHWLGATKPMSKDVFRSSMFSMLKASSASIPPSNTSASHLQLQLNSLSSDLLTNRQWNDDLQAVCALPRTNGKDRYIRDASIAKIYQDFTVAATHGAVSVVEGLLPPINPTDPASMRMFVHQNIFYVYALDSFGEHADGDEGCRANPKKELNMILALTKAKIPGFSPMLSTVVDYKGVRIFAQAVLPGLFYGEKVFRHVYGSLDQGKTYTTIASNEETSTSRHKSLTHDEKETVSRVLDLVSQHLHVTSRFVPASVGSDAEVESSSPTNVKLSTGSQTKGMFATDGNFYLLDLFSSAPRDANYPDEEKNASYTLRPELVDAHFRAKAHSVAFSKTAEETIGAPPSEDASEDEKQAYKSKEIALRQEQLEKYVELYNSYKLNPDILVASKRNHVEALSSTERQQHERDIKEAGDYLVNVAIPTLVSDICSMSVVPVDGVALTEIMHSRGINMRYLGKVHSLCLEHVNAINEGSDSETGDEALHPNNSQAIYSNAKYALELCQTEAIARAMKVFVRRAIRLHRGSSLSSPLLQVAPTVSDLLALLLNGLFGSKSFGEGLSQEQVEAVTSIATAYITKDHDDHVHDVKISAKIAQLTSPTDAGIDEDSILAFIRENPFRSVYPRGFETEAAAMETDDYIMPHVKTLDKSLKELQIDSSRFSTEVIWGTIRSFVLQKFSIELPHTLVLSAREKLVLLRSLCLSSGLTMKTRDFDFDSTPVFMPEDVAGLFPVVSSNIPSSSDASDLLSDVATSISNSMESIAAAYAAVSEACMIHEKISGTFSKEHYQALTNLSSTVYKLGEVEAAIDNQHITLLVAQKTFGLDHHETAQAHIQLAFYLLIMKKYRAALTHLDRAQFLFEFLGGLDSPHAIAALTNKAAIFQTQELHAVAEDMFAEVSRRNLAAHGKNSIQYAVALQSHALALAYCGRLPDAITQEKKASEIFTKLGGSVDEIQASESSDLSEEERKELHQKRLQQQMQKNPRLADSLSRTELYSQYLSKLSESATTASPLSAFEDILFRIRVHIESLRSNGIIPSTWVNLATGCTYGNSNRVISVHDLLRSVESDAAKAHSPLGEVEQPYQLSEFPLSVPAYRAVVEKARLEKEEKMKNTSSKPANSKTSKNKKKARK